MCILFPPVFPEGIMTLIKTYHIPPGLEHVQSPSPRWHLCFQQLSSMFAFWLATLGLGGNCSLRSSCPSFPIPSPPLQCKEEKQSLQSTEDKKLLLCLELIAQKKSKQHKTGVPWGYSAIWPLKMRHLPRKKTPRVNK